MKEIVPDFDVPSTNGLREPILECRGLNASWPLRLIVASRRVLLFPGSGRITNFLEESKACLATQYWRHAFGWGIHVV